jgi:hypothetical protein
MNSKAKYCWSQGNIYIPIQANKEITFLTWGIMSCLGVSFMFHPNQTNKQTWWVDYSMVESCEEGLLS